MTPPGPGWFQRLMSVLFIIFCFELGLFLLIYPWTDGWSDNYFAWAVRGTVQTSLALLSGTTAMCAALSAVWAS